MKYIEQKIGPLNVIDIPGKAGMPVCVLFHGYGAGKEDLAGLSSYLKMPEGTRYIFPDGIFEIDLGYHQTGRAWFPIDFAEIEKARIQGTTRDLSKAAPKGLEKAHKAGVEFLKALGVPLKQVILGGFSQGAMLATELTLNSRETLGGLLILSGTLLSADDWKRKAALLPGFRFFQSHGKNDFVLPFVMAQKLHETLIQAGMKGDLVTFDGGHEIPLEVIEKANGYLQNLFSDRA